MQIYCQYTRIKTCLKSVSTFLILVLSRWLSDRAIKKRVVIPNFPSVKFLCKNFSKMYATSYLHLFDACKVLQIFEYICYGNLCANVCVNLLPTY